MTVPTKVCPQCNREFACTESEACWCAIGVPRVQFEITPSGAVACLCPPCLQSFVVDGGVFERGWSVRQ